MGTISTFVNEALSHKGEDGEWTWSTSGLGRGNPWCAAFVCAVAKTVGVLDTMIYKSFVCGGMFKGIVESCGGTYIAGPAWGSCPTPQSGDIIFYCWDGVYGNKYTSDHVGIVVSSDGSKVTTIEGNTGSWNDWLSHVGSHDYSVSYNCISGYARPNWGESSFVYGGKLYDTESTSEDMTLREVCYSNYIGEPSISTTGIELSVVNYTSGLAGLVAGFSCSSDVSGDSDGLTNQNAKVIYQVLSGKGLDASQCCGILGNIQQESNFNPASVNSIGATGICQWYQGRATRMKQFVGSGWESNLSGQVEYLWYELNNGYSSVLQLIQAQVGNNETTTKAVARIFFDKFEKAGDDTLSTRQGYAVTMFNQVMSGSVSNIA